MAKVAVVTRTRDRPLMLERARASIAAQTMRDFAWVIVNDGGDPRPVEEMARYAKKDLGLDATILHREESLGMEAASNAGVRASTSTYIAMHDDDDSWDPGYLAATTAFLDTNGAFVGVVTQVRKITERVDGRCIRRVRSEPHMPLLEAIHIADMTRMNLFPPIAFTYRRMAYDETGGYDETLRVLGDWDFNLRMLLRGDIGVIPEMLANYHVRDTDGSGDPTYSNSVVQDYHLHVTSNAAYRNRKIREDVAAGEIGLGFLLANGHLQEMLRRRLQHEVEMLRQERLAARVMNTWKWVRSHLR